MTFLLFCWIWIWIQLKTKVKWAKFAKGRSAGEVGSARNGRLLSPTASRDQLSGAFFFFASKGKRWNRFYRLARNLSGFKHNKPKKCMHVGLCTQVCAWKRAGKSSYAHWDLRYHTTHTLCLILASICVNRTTFKFIEMGEGAIN